MKNVKFSFNANDWQKKLSPLFKIIKASTVLPILELIHVSIANEKINFYASDLEINLIIELPVNTKDKISFCINAKQLKKLLLNCNKINPDVKAVVNDVSAYFEFGDFKLKLSVNTEGDGPDSYPAFPDIKKNLVDKSGNVLSKKYATMDVGIMMPILKDALLFCSNDHLRPAMKGIFIHDNNGNLDIASTDAHRLYFNTIMPVPKNLAGVNMIIPKEGVKIMLEAFKSGDIEICQIQTCLWIENEDKKMFIRLVDARYPDYKVVIPKMEKSFYLKRIQLRNFLNIAVLYMGPKYSSQILLEVSNDCIKAIGENKDYDVELNYTLPVFNKSVEFEPYKILYNIYFLLTILNLSKDEYVKIDHFPVYTDHLPVNTVSNRYIFDDHYLIMPVNING